MRASDIPAKFPIPFANAAGPDYIRPIPQASQIGITNGAASLADGFPPLNFVPVAAGGIPPFGRDMNGIMQQVSAWARWQAAGVAAAYDATFATAIGGYPRGALVLLSRGHAIAKSGIDNNMNDPNLGFGTTWDALSSIYSSRIWQAAGSANAQAITISPSLPPTSLAQLQSWPIRFFSVGTNTGAPTLNANGLGAVPIVTINGSPLAANMLMTGEMFEVVYDGTKFVMQTATSVFPDTSALNGGVTIDGRNNSAGGAGIRLIGNGGTTPSKFLRAFGGQLQVVNNAYSTAIVQVADDGSMFLQGLLETNGNVIANNGRLRATFGARGSGDGNAATLLADYATAADTSPVANSWWRLAPDGFLEQGGFIQIAPGTLNQIGLYPVTFGRVVYGIEVTIGSIIVDSTTTGTVGISPAGLAGPFDSLAGYAVSNSNAAGPTQGLFWRVWGY